MPSTLGDLEQLVMLALVRLGDSAYGVTVRDAITARTERELAFATIYTTLARLESKGLVASHVGQPTPERGGRAKKHFKLTATGLAALKQSLDDLRAMTHDLGAQWGGVA
jgi:PadR family transcriptional regulator PadR